MTQLSDLEHLVALADMRGAHVRLRKRSKDRAWTVSVVTDICGLKLAVATADGVTGAVLACLAKLRAKEVGDAE